MRKRLSEEVTREEMLRLREQGYSNTEIAEQLECCYPTVIKYIGKSGIRRANRKDENPAEIKKPEAVTSDGLNWFARRSQAQALRLNCPVRA